MGIVPMDVGGFDGGMASYPLLVLAGAVVGVLYGLFGVGSAFATPLLAMLGVPGLAAVASPLPALVPGSASGGWAHARGGNLDARLAKWTLLGAAPTCIVGSVASRWVGGPWLLVLSGFCLLLVGVRVLMTTRQATAEAALAEGASTETETHGVAVATKRPLRSRTLPIVLIGALIGFAAGLLANGGGFLLVPTFLLALGMTLPEATATSLVVVTVLSVPAVLTHALLGDIDWAVALPFAAGLVPATAIAARLASHLDVAHLRNTFGLLLMVVGGWFLYRELRLLGLA
jgi:uncharacterized membrane protein YfcA